MSILNTGITGLNAAQTALYATSNNIANVYTPGFNREVVVLGEAKNSGGVQVNAVNRQFNSFIADRLNSANGNLSSLQAYKSQAGQIDNLLADPDAGLAPLMQRFFGAIGDLAGSPAEPAAREGVLGNANSMAAQFRSFDSYLYDMQRTVNGSVELEVSQINDIAGQIAMLNKEIASSAAATGQAPNGLLNQRDQYVAELSTKIDVRVNIQDGGAYSVSIGNGQPLVSGENSFQLEAVQSSSDPERIVVGYRDAVGNLMEFREDQFKGGALGGLMSFRRENLDKVQGQLGQLAITMAQAFNEQHQSGVDLNGDAGAAFFSIGAPTSYTNTNNSGDAVLDVAVNDLSNLTSSSWDLTFNGTDWQATQRDTGRRTTISPDADGNLNFAGMQISVAGNPAEGDRFRVNPVQRAARDFAVQIDDIAQIAAATSADSGDNRNALALQDLQTSRLVGGNANFAQAYGAIVSDSGNRNAVVNANLAAQQGLTEQLQALQQSESGVNLDEEAANLIRYQQYYQANAKVIEAGMTVLETILSIAR
ncbi:flagellar hook-associated protein FlgK [Aliidiomarina iranensis]|uniref:Flagellar hook-associated protein 1 n=1 Tax=Aliidiomarina iranensis TaxID=1434071 RepID=A0A432W1U6_9GAMM|nr:flagellar hook-associated protein FlgK [Aliidiomarina iranensis]RUO23195.1 flagellar hook-associated protein FlgK [Aliidiomarina iranensis]